jgi:hypothetical protein
LKLKYGICLPRPSIEQIFERFFENPNDFPKNKSTAIIPAIAGPETYQGQGLLKSEIIFVFLGY